MTLDYFSIIHHHIAPDSAAYRPYLVHVTLVTQKALAIGRQLKVSAEQLTFIEEASMLHDIGICKVNAPEIGCTGTLPYIAHGTEGRTILESEGLPSHALVCERHTGVGLSLKEIIDRQLPLPQRDMLPESLEEKIICWADLFYSKVPKKIWLEKNLPDIEQAIAEYGPENYEHYQKLRRELNQ